MENFKSVWYSDLFDRSILDMWIENCSRTFADRLRDKTARLMEHQPKPLSIEILAEMGKMEEHWV